MSDLEAVSGIFSRDMLTKNVAVCNDAPDIYSHVMHSIIYQKLIEIFHQSLHNLVSKTAKGTLRQVGFQQKFIDEELPMPVMWVLFGYVPCEIY